jgi:transposase
LVDIDLAALPDDPTTLQHLLCEMAAAAEQRHSVLRDAVQQRDAEIDKLHLLIKRLLRHQFGRRSEQLTPEQLQLGIEDLERTIAAAEAGQDAADPAGAKPQPRREACPNRNHGALPAHLSRYEVLIDIEQRDCPCCGGALHVIDEERSEQLDIVPAQLRVRVTRRPRYGCRACEGAVLVAPAPERPIDGGMATEAMIAHVLVSKVGDSLPLYRQSKMLERQGITLDRSTLSKWVGRACWWLTPLHDLVLSTALSAPKLFADDTTLPVLDPGRGRTKTGRLWCYAVDDRPWRGPGHPIAAYVYSEDRKNARPAGHLAGFRGVLQVDGYAGFKRLAGDRADASVCLAFCWTHTIRTQSHFGRGRIPWRMPLQRDDMLDLQAIVVNDDTLDDQLQDSLAFDDAGGGLQPGADTLRESCQAGQHLLGLKLLRTQAKTLLMLLLCPLTLLRQGFALVG